MALVERTLRRKTWRSQKHAAAKSMALVGFGVELAPGWSKNSTAAEASFCTPAKGVPPSLSLAWTSWPLDPSKTSAVATANAVACSGKALVVFGVDVGPLLDKTSAAIVPAGTRRAALVVFGGVGPLLEQDRSQKHPPMPYRRGVKPLSCY